MRRRANLALAWTLAAAVAIAFHPAGAHRPGLLPRDSDVEAPEISAALYGAFRTGDEVFVVRLSYDAPFALPFELLVPHQQTLREHRPLFAVVGPGLPAPSPSELASLPRALPDGAGAYVERDDGGPRLVIFESFVRRAYWSSGPVALPLEAADYEVWIWSPRGTKGDFALGFGVEEDFSGVGCGEMMRDWSDYAY